MKKNAYSVYLFFCFCFSLLFSMATVLSLVYHLEIVGLNAFQLVFVGTVLETSCFLFEIPTGIVADLYSRRRSILIGVFLYGIGFLIEGAFPWFATVLFAQVVWGCGDTFLTGALEAWIASEKSDSAMDKTFLRGGQFRQFGGFIGILAGTFLGNFNLQLPIIVSGILFIILGFVLIIIMPETNFMPALDKKQSIILDMLNLFKLNLRTFKGTPVLLFILGITLCGGLASEGFDRLSTAHFIENTVFPTVGNISQVTWFGIMSIFGMILGILTSQFLVSRLEKNGEFNRKTILLLTSSGYIVCMLIFAFSHQFWIVLVMYLMTRLMRTIKDPILNAWMNDHVEERFRATMFSTSGQIDAMGQIIGGAFVGMIAQKISIAWGLGCTALLLVPSLLFIVLAEKYSKN